MATPSINDSLSLNVQYGLHFWLIKFLINGNHSMMFPLSFFRFSSLYMVCYVSQMDMHVGISVATLIASLLSIMPFIFYLCSLCGSALIANQWLTDWVLVCILYVPYIDVFLVGCVVVCAIVLQHPSWISWPGTFCLLLYSLLWQKSCDRTFQGHVEFCASLILYYYIIIQAWIDSSLQMPWGIMLYCLGLSWVQFMCLVLSMTLGIVVFLCHRISCMHHFWWWYVEHVTICFFGIHLLCFNSCLGNLGVPQLVFLILQQPLTLQKCACSIFIFVFHLYLTCS